MITLTATPTLNQLYEFISKVKTFPISVHELLSLARNLREPKEVIDFYKAFDPNQVFSDVEDLTSRSEQVEIMHAEVAEMPQEIERSPEEY